MIIVIWKYYLINENYLAMQIAIREWWLQSGNVNIIKGDLAVQIKQSECKVKLVVRLKAIEYKRVSPTFYLPIRSAKPFLSSILYDLSNLSWNNTSHIHVLIIYSYLLCNYTCYVMKVFDTYCLRYIPSLLHYSHSVRLYYLEKRFLDFTKVKLT